jgi:hypothetical protein
MAKIYATNCRLLLDNMNDAEIIGVIANDVNDHINLLVRIAHIICKHPLFVVSPCQIIM